MTFVSDLRTARTSAPTALFRLMFDYDSKGGISTRSLKDKTRNHSTSISFSRIYGRLSIAVVPMQW